ncbi:MAG TPA: DUF2515 family protein [Cerasibacillus sp.]|uniref:DUF2515 family protein n=1 Tax=Cerasibacillus sp. TaxID=2498711 RepID=UPI002F3F7D37
MKELNDYIHYITKQTEEHNFDNISRTKAYFDYYCQNPEVEWTFLASIVSRNAGWNMTDLKLLMFQQLLGKKTCHDLFMTYEEANARIFSDAYPQLLIYALSKNENRPLFHLLHHFNVSQFMQKEWTHFWRSKQKTRLVIALIINEQHVIETPIIQKHTVFHELPYRIQNIFKLNAVLLPTITGKIYGSYTHGFTKINCRIKLGKTIYSLLFHPRIYPLIYYFSKNIPHTGSRHDYEQFLSTNLPSAPPLRKLYSHIPYLEEGKEDWSLNIAIPIKWSRPNIIRNFKEIGPSFYFKRRLLNVYYRLKEGQ